MATKVTMISTYQCEETKKVKTKMEEKGDSVSVLDYNQSMAELI
jgi:membrane-bound inhibitor of C-type lysozyme